LAIFQPYRGVKY